jgi:transposase
MLGPISWRTPPHRYGPWETVVHYLTEGLVERGYDVTLFATGDSVTKAKLEWVCPHGFYEDESLEAGVYQWLHISNAFEKAHEFDILHSHYDFYPLTFSRLTDTPLLTTIHGFSSDRILPVYRKYWDNYYVSISNADRAEGLNYVATVYNGSTSTPLSMATPPTIIFSSSDAYRVTRGRTAPFRWQKKPE